jgi:dTDP-4-amino-4,6-dideoxy-D-glucose ammonia-lyase
MRLGYKHYKPEPKKLDISSYPENIRNICKILSNDPFESMGNISNKLNISKDQLQDLSIQIRKDDYLQEFILTQGTGRKYWENTVTSLMESGKLVDAIKNNVSYPNRIGLFPGIRCQFYCTFCGRDYAEKYSDEVAKKSFEVFKKVIDEDPKDDFNWEDRFRISGGLEPLTNPYIGQIVSYGASKGFLMQMYTNGFALSPAFLKKQPGIFDLERLRISLYGVDDVSYEKVTRVPKSFNIVKNNLINFLKENINKKSIKIGLNWIILPGQSALLKPLFNFISEVSISSGRPLDYITLREDFSQSGSVISNEEREELKEIFYWIENQCKEKDELKDLYVDYGYALNPLTDGKNVGPLKMINYKDMPDYGFPQVATCLDSKGNLYVYHESGFLDRSGSERYIAGNIIESNGVVEVVRKHLQNKPIAPMPFDVGFLDAFDHTVSILMKQANLDKKFGIPWNKGPVKIRSYD